MVVVVGSVLNVIYVSNVSLPLERVVMNMHVDSATEIYVNHALTKKFHLNRTKIYPTTIKQSNAQYVVQDGFGSLKRGSKFVNTFVLN